ncbi:MAG TPA: hypothetical protein VMZ27_01885 [Candidatus Saccharimonadales bacterium]|jgi:hypothetical protein|nr:hypothetical protein [Candidatus Saccharimonadales bacterium]
MSARKIEDADLFQAITVQGHASRLALPSGAFRIRKNGIEFRSEQAIPTWTEMTILLETPADSKKLSCTGVVVACTGNRHVGYVVSMLFTSLSRQAQARLNTLAFSSLA